MRCFQAKGLAKVAGFRVDDVTLTGLEARGWLEIQLIIVYTRF